MRFTIIVPVYNAEGTIDRCVESIIASGFPDGDYEIILVNDGSTDGSGNICDFLAQKYPFIRVITQNNRGLSEARNAGIAMADGDFVCFCDSDDYYAPSSIRNVITYCFDGIDLIRFYCDIVLQENRCVSEQVEGKVTFQGTGKEYLRRFGIETFCWNYLYRRDFLVSNGLFFTPGILAEDIDYIFHVMIADPMIISTSYHVYQYAIRPNSISTNRSPSNSNRFATDFAGTLLRISSVLEEYKDTDSLLYHSCRKSLDTRVVTLFSRVLSSDYSIREFKTLLNSLKVAGLLSFKTSPSSNHEQVSRAVISIVSHYPGFFPMVRWVFRHFFLPVIYPRVLRKSTSL